MEKFLIPPLNHKCSYCGDFMRIVKERSKRSVPKGAKDLDIYDELYSWKCPKCHLLGGVAEISTCNRCGEDTVKIYDASSASDIAISLEFIYRGTHFDSDSWQNSLKNSSDACTNCMLCCVCKEPLNSRALYHFVFRRDMKAPYHSGGTDVVINNFYIHAACAEKHPDAEERVRAGDWDYIHIVDYFLSPERQEKKKLEIQQKREIQEKTMTRNEEMIRRNDAGLCVLCGKGFRLFAGKSPQELYTGGIQGFAHKKCQDRGSFQE